MTDTSSQIARTGTAANDEDLLGQTNYARPAIAVANGESLAGGAQNGAADGNGQAQGITQTLPPRTAHQLFQDQVERTPDNVALEFATNSISYAELDRAASRFAHKLVSSGVRTGQLVGLFVDRGPNAIIAILGTLKAGAAFLPLDPTYPQERIRLMLEDAQPCGVVTTSALREIFAQRHDAIPVWEINSADLLDAPNAGAKGAKEVNGADINSPCVTTTPDDLAYAIFTSGSTGRPKAALLTHRGLRNLCTAQQAMFPVTANSRVLQFASLCFDASISEIFVTLTCGATLCLVQEGDLAPSRLANTLNKLQVTVATIPPSVLTALVDAELPWLQTLITAGESCPPSLVDHFSARHRLINAYGPTEATVCATMHVCDPAESGPPPIGRGIPGCDVLILNENQRECADGETGEVYLGGIGLAEGYLNRSDLTAEKFVRLGENGKAARWYRTGDLARRRPDGLIEFVGRRDQQVKIRGVRIELGELEHTLGRHPYVQEAVVTTDDTPTGKRLIAHVAGGNGSPLTSQDVLGWLRSRVIPAMLPSEIHCRAEMPLLPNGKIDRKALNKAAADAKQAESLESDEPLRDPIRESVGPRDRFELAVMDAFKSVLDLTEIQLNDDFFALGGDSLQAMDLLARVEADFGVMPSMAQVMQEPTVEGVARAISSRVVAPESDPDSQWSPLTPLTPYGAAHPPGARPLYCVHPGGGNALCFLDLARRLADDRPVVGLTSRGLEPGQTPLETVSDLAAEYIAAIRSAQPEGPYAIAGWSFGGIVAFEIANQLIQAGEEIEHLAIIDIGLLYSFGVLTTLFPEGDLALFELRRLPPDDQIREFTTRTAAAKLIPPGAPVELARRIYDTFMANVDAMMNYRPDHFPGRMTIYRAGEPLVRLRRELADEWQPFCDNIEICTVAGNHLTMIHEPNVSSLAEELRQRLAFR